MFSINYNATWIWFLSWFSTFFHWSLFSKTVLHFTPFREQTVMHGWRHSSEDTRLIQWTFVLDNSKQRAQAAALRSFCLVLLLLFETVFLDSPGCLWTLHPSVSFLSPELQACATHTIWFWVSFCLITTSSVKSPAQWMYTGKQISLGEVLGMAELWDFGVTFPVSIFLEPPRISCLNNKEIILVPEAKRQRSMCWQGLFLLRPLSSPCRWPFSLVSVHA